jgi:hypothetical protein
MTPPPRAAERDITVSSRVVTRACFDYPAPDYRPEYVCGHRLLARR